MTDTNYSWKSGVSLNWNNSGAWVGGIPNGTTAAVTINASGSYTVTLPSATAFTVDTVVFNDSTANFNDSGTLTLGGTLASFTFDGNQFILGAAGAIAGGLLDIDSGILVNQGGKILSPNFILGAGGTISLGGKALTLSGSSTLDGSIYGNGAAGNTLAVTGVAAFGDTSEHLAGRTTLAVSGTVVQTDAAAGQNLVYLGANYPDSGAINIAAGGTYSLVGTGVGNEIINEGLGTITNAGLLKSSFDASKVSYGENAIYAPLISTGTIGSDLGILALFGGGNIGGKLTGAGEIDFASGNFFLSPTIAISTATLGFVGGSVVTLGSNLDLSHSAVTDNFGTIELAGHHLTLAGATLEGTGDFYGPGTVTLTGVTTETGFYVVDGAKVEVTGTLVQSGSGLNITVGPPDTAVIQIDQGAVYVINGTSSGPSIQDNNGGGTLVNAGLIVSNITAAGNADQVFAALNSTGTIDSASGLFQMEGGGNLSGVLTGAGEIDFVAGNFSLGSNLSINAPTTIGIEGGLVTLGSNLTPALFNMTSGTIVLAGHTVSVAGNGALNGEIDGTGTVTVTGTRSIANLSDNAGATLVDDGTLVQTGAIYLGTGFDPSGPLVINAGALYDMIGTGGLLVQNAEATSIGGSFVNAGTLVSSESYYGGPGSGPNVIDAYVINTGTLDAAAGVLQLGYGGLLGGTLMGQEIDLANYAAFTLAPMAVISTARLDLGAELIFTNNVTYGGAFQFDNTGSALLYLNGRQVNFSGPVSLQNGYVYGGLLQLSGPAVVGNLYVSNNAELEDSSTITQTGNVQLGQNDSGTLAIDAGAVYDLQNQGGNGFNIGASGDAEIYNAGLFEQTGFSYDNQSDNISATLHNTGTVTDLGAGNLNFTAPVINDGLITLASTNFPIGAADMGFGGALTADAGKTGTIVLGANAVLEAAGPVTGQKIQFTTAGTLGSDLLIGALSQFSGTVAGFAGGDVIDLQNLLANGATYANNILTLTETQTGSALALVGTLALSGVTGSIALDFDGNGGTNILLNEPAATYSNPASTPATKTWFGAAGNWATAADWSPTGQPGSNGIALINDANTYTIAYAETDTVYQLADYNQNARLWIEGGKLIDEAGGISEGTLQINSANFQALTGFDFQGLVSLASTGTLEADTGTVIFSGAAVLGGTIAGDGRLDGNLNFLAGANVVLSAGFTDSGAALNFSGAAVSLGANQTLAVPVVIEGSGINFSGHTLVLGGASVIGNQAGGTALLGAGTLDITGTAALGVVAISGNANLADARLVLQNNNIYVGNSGADTSSILIAAGATYALGDNGAALVISDSGAGQLKNAGLLELTGYGNDTDQIALPIFNTGTILAAEGDLQLTGGGTLGGALAGAGEIDLLNGGFVVQPGLVDSVANLGLIDATLYLNGTTLALSGTSELGNSAGNEVNVYGAGDLKITGTASLDGFYLEGNKTTLEVAGTINQTGGSPLGLDYRSPATDSSALIIDHGGVYDLVNAGEQILWNNGNQSVVNAGLLETSGGFAPGAVDQIAPVFINTGTVLVNVGDLQFQDGGTLGGTFAGSGEIDLTGGNFRLNALSSSVAVLNASGANLTLASNTSIASSFIDSSGTISLAGHILTLAGGLGVLSNIVSGPGTLKVTGALAITQSGAHQYLSGGAVLEDAGVITEATGYSLYLGQGGNDSGNLLIDSGAVFNLGDGSGIYQSSLGSVTNNGTILATGGLIVAPLINTGTLNIASGILELQGGGTLGGLVTGPGQIDLNAGKFLLAPTLNANVTAFSSEAQVTLGANLGYGGVFTDTNAINLAGHSLTLSGAGDVVAGNLNGPGTLLATGTVAITESGEHLYLSGGALLEDAGTMSATTGYSLYFGTNSNDTGNLRVDAGAVFNIAASGIYVTGHGAITNNGIFNATNSAPIYAAINNAGTFNLAGAMLTGNGVLTNTGLFDFTSGQIGNTGGILNSGLFLADLGAGNTSDIDTPLDNFGTLIAASGMLAVSGGGVLGGTIGGGAGAIVLNSDFTLTQGTTSTVTFGSGAQFGSGVYDIPGGDNTFLDGAGTLITAGTLAVADNGANFDTYLTGGPTWIDTGTVNDAGWIGFGTKFSPDSGTLAVAATGVFNFTGDDGGLLVAQSDTGYHYQVTNAGLLEKSGGTGTSGIAVTVTNTGTIAALSGTLALTGAMTNDANGTLTGGTWEASGPGSTLALLAGPVVTTDAANIILSGYPTGGEIITGAAAPQTLESSLASIAGTGTLQVLGFDTYFGGTALTDAGVIDLAGGNFVGAGLTIAPTGTFQGFGGLNGAVQNNGLITALGKLTLANAITGTGTIALPSASTLVLGSSVASGETIAFGGTHALLVEGSPATMLGTLSGLAPGDTIDIASGSVTSAAFTGTDLFITLSGAGGVLDEKLTGLAPGARSAITSDGKSGSDLTLYRQAAAAAIAPNPLAFGNHHVGDIVTAGLTIANIAPSDGYSEGLDASFTVKLGSISEAGSLVTLAAGASNSAALSIGLLTATAGSLAGSAVISLASDGAGFDGNGPLGLGSQTIAVTGAAYAYGAGHLSSTTIALGPVHANAVDQAYVTLQNAAGNVAYTEALDAGFTGNSGAAAAFGTLSLLAAGVSNSTGLAVGLNDATAGSLTGTATLGLTSDGALTSQLGTTALAAQTITVTGSVFNLATAGGLPGTISLGQHHVGAPVAVLVTLANTAAPGAYSEKLDASFSGTKLTSGSFSTAGALTTLAAGAQSTALSIKEITTTAGTIGGAAFITLTSDGAGIDTLGKTGLGVDTIAVTGAVFNLATASLGAATLSLGQHHAGVLSTAAINVRNSAAAGAYSEKLDAKFTGTSFTAGSFTTGGTIATLGAGATSFGLAVTLAGAGGLIAGNATLGLTSDGTGIDTLGLTGLTAQTIAVTGTLFNEATAAISLGTLALGQFHAGAVATGDITLANSAPKGIYSEGLDAAFSGTTLTHGSFSAAGSVSTLLAGGTDATDLAISLATGTAGTISGVATLALKSDGTGIDSLGTTALAAKTETITGTVFAYAAPKLASTIVNFGILHAGTAATQALVLSNTNTAAGYTESLDAGFTGASAGVAASGTIAHLGAGLTNSTSLALGFAASQNGAVSGTATLALTSDGAGLDTLGTTALGPQVITLTGTIDNYATVALEQLGGAGTLTGSGANYLLNLGDIQQGGGNVTASLGVLNAATGVADSLSGGFAISNTSGAFTDTGFGTFSALAAGQADAAPVITLSGINAGAFSELITLSAAGSNASGYKGALGNITLDVTGTVLHTYTLSGGADTLNGAGNDLIIAKSGQLSAGDIINAGTGTNILTLSGGGTFNMGAPATLTGISIVEAQENIGTLAQTLDINSGFGGVVNAASGPAGSSLTVIGNYGGAIINLGNGNDTVYINAPEGTINGGGGNDVFYASDSDMYVIGGTTISTAINGGAGANTLEVSGSSFVMGDNITSISSVVINDLPGQAENFVANAITGLAITGGAGNDSITLGDASQSVVTGTGNTTIYATAAQAGAAITVEGNATLDLTTGGTAVLNANDDFLTVSLASATNLTLSSMSFITAIGSSGKDTITALAAQQTLTGGAGVDTLIGYGGFGDVFQDTAAGLNTDTIQYFGGNDLIDLTDLARAGASLSYVVSATAGTLSVTAGAISTSILLSGGTNLAQSRFHMTGDGHGGTNISLI
jgi:hypothetical protein